MPEKQPSDQSQNVWRTTPSGLQELHVQTYPLIALDTPAKKKDEWVLLTDCGARKAHVIFALRDTLGLSLVEAKRLVSSVPAKIPVPITNSHDQKQTQREILDICYMLLNLGAKFEWPEWEEWKVFEFDRSFMSLFPRLQLRSDWDLLAQVFAGPDWGSCRIWTMPPNAPSWREQTPHLLDGEAPKGVGRFSEALQGDRSPQSFMEASLLCRWMHDVGADYHLADDGWSRHEQLCIPSMEVDWEWKVEDVTDASDFEPRVESTSDGHTVVTFYSVSRHVRQTITRHRDRYGPDSYCFKTETCVCADGGLGYVE